jgi:hypothetical protein
MAEAWATVSGGSVRSSGEGDFSGATSGEQQLVR